MAHESWNIAGKTVLITGANRGIGLATAKGLAEKGARVVLCCRTRAKAEEASDYIKQKTGNNDIHVLTADLASLESIRTACEDFTVRFESLHVLINNAAVIPQKRELSADGYELQLAVNWLAPFAMTGRLLDMLKKSAPARIITVSSNAHRRSEFDFDDPNFERQDYGKVTAYARSKVADILFTEELARKLENTGVTANCLHPGVIDTGLLQDFSGLPRTLGFVTKVFKGTERGAKTSIYLAADPDVGSVSGRYFDDCTPAEPGSGAGDRDKARRLWSLGEQFSGIRY